MKQVICYNDVKRYYNTDLATTVSKQIGNAETTLYRKRNGEYFLAILPDKIKPLSYLEASRWAAENIPQDLFYKEFGSIVKNNDDNRINIKISLPKYMILKLKREAAAEHISVSRIIEGYLPERFHK
jgi:hypothetical protein